MRRKRCIRSNEEVLLKAILKQLEKGDKRIMATLQELKDAIEAINSAVEADVEQDKKVVEAINVLIKKIEDLGQTQDFKAEVDALKAAGEKLGKDNADVQAAIDAAVPPVNP